MSNRRVVLPGIVIGVLLLALAAAFAIALPKVGGESGGDITLPDRLPGGYTATDLAVAYENAPGATDDKVQEASASERTARTYGNKVLADSGVVAATRTYVNADLSAPLVVQAFRASGGAFSPFQFSDPKTAQAGQEIQHLVRERDVLCIEHGSADGQGSVQAAYVECQKSEDGLTIQVTSTLALDKAVDLVDDVFAELS